MDISPHCSYRSFGSVIRLSYVLLLSTEMAFKEERERKSDRTEEN